ncbi:P-loop containing nucleoside triphosphate hydrolase [Pseudocohnilembus persalinus]|uniref:p-loop containing nucleoside triphosphate hydrolase n=1 Tax=Pseudocohnilembus persalinus TaxID=266149 RepID=A0A0V0QXA9_PSEPJ|nr:P-loop containing nucleoside triphosphate hydrolase [Pseudocohnilembus persalinus]|eukprot:KRX06862.1 P-loop containing nucleoside triphosphate hydrolase [Pseudocohnilembus persalinus]
MKNSRFNQFGTKTAQIKLQSGGIDPSKTTPKRNSRLTSPGKSGNLAFNKTTGSRIGKQAQQQKGQQQNESSQMAQDEVQDISMIAADQGKNSQNVSRGEINLQGVGQKANTSQDKKITNIQKTNRGQESLNTTNQQISNLQVEQNAFDQNDDSGSPLRKQNVGQNFKPSAQVYKKGNSIQYDSKQQGGVVDDQANSDFILTQGKVTNIKTFVRFRPVNKMEQDLTEQGIGRINVHYQNDKTVKTLNDNNSYTFDKVYRPDTTQAQVYKEAFSESLDDALKGYNGTLFAYGPTGSGKTHTMFGPDINDNVTKGIIPRTAQEIFDKISKEGQDLTYIISVSMLEIYREQLSDLMDSEKSDLKIKETPKRGVYVSGLSSNEVSNSQELLDIIHEGFSCKQTRSTKMNEYSSRSHTIVQINIVIRHQSGAEKAGKLNLIDLAGSEKVWKSGAEGASLEEAKKINLSLSCLGNVINALTTKSSHIPYRDSKLTRILQESLGGNFKTAIIVACSPHSSMAEESTMALRFATRAKQIKLTYGMNIKQSQDTLRMIIDQLRAELKNVNGELNSYKIILEKTRKALADQPGGQNKDAARVVDQIMLQVQQQLALPEEGSNNLDEEEQVAVQFLSQPNPTQYKQLANIETRQLREQLEEKMEKIEQLELQAFENKKKMVDLQQKYTDLQEEKNIIEVKYSKEKSDNQYKEFKIDILNKQLQALVQKVCKNEQDFAQLLKERKELTETRIEDYLKKDLQFQEIKLSDYFKSSYNFNFDLEFQRLEEVQKNLRTLTLQEIDQNMLKTFAEDIQDLNKTFVMQTQIMPNEMNQSFIGNLDFGSTLSSNNKGLLKTIEFPSQLEQMYAHIINQHLVRTINALEWKQVIEYGKYKMNSNLNQILSSHVFILEDLLKSSQDTHKRLRKRFDEIEFEHNQVRNQLQHGYLFSSNIKGSRVGQSASKRRQSIRQSNIKQKQNQKQQMQSDDMFKDYSWIQEIKQIIDESEKNVQYKFIYNQEGLKKAQDELRHQTDLLKKVWEETNMKTLPIKQEEKQPDQDAMLVEEIKEKERLQNKILSLEQELKSLRAASNQYKKAYAEEKKNRLNTKQLMEELEVALRNNLREENETWQNTTKNMREQYDREIMIRQIETTKLQEKFQGIAYHALNQVQKLKQQSNVSKADIDSLINEMMRLTDLLNNTNQLLNSSSKDKKPKAPVNGTSKNDGKQRRLY